MSNSMPWTTQTPASSNATALILMVSMVNIPIAGVLPSADKRTRRLDVSNLIGSLVAAGNPASARGNSESRSLSKSRPLQHLELRDQSFYHRKAHLPEARVAGVQPEGGEQLLVALRAAGF